MRSCGRKEDGCESVRRTAGQCRDQNRRASFSAMIVLVSCLFADTCLALRCLPNVRTMTASRLATSSNRAKIRQGALHIPGRLHAVLSMQGVVLRGDGCSTSCLQAKWSQNITVEDSTRSDENQKKNASDVDSVMADQDQDISELFDFHDVNINRLIKPPHNESFDLMSIQNDISILSIYSLSQAICELVAQGPKDTPGMTLTDWIIVSRYFTSAATLSISWVAAGIMLNQFQKGSWHVFEHENARFKDAFRCWLIAMPLHQILCAAGGVQHSMPYTVSEVFGSLGVVLLWRKVEPYLY